MASIPPPLKEKFLSDFLHGHLSQDEVNLGIELYLQDIVTLSHLAVVVLDADFEYDSTFENTENIHSYYGVIQTLLEHEFSDSEFFYMTAITPSVYGFIASYKNNKDFTDRLKNLLLNIEIDFGVSMHSTVSEEILFWESIPHILLTTYYRHTSNKLSPVSKTVSSVDEHNFAVMYSPELENEIYASCIRQNKEKLTSSLNLFLKENLNNQSGFDELCPQLSTLFYALCIRIFTFTRIDSEKIFGQEYNIYYKLSHCADSTAFTETIHYIFMTISDAIKNAQKLDEHNYGKNMIDYIQLHYNEDISLHDLATYMNMSQAYVSRLFKKLTNYNFKDYLANLRIKKAVEFLNDNPSMSIQEVSAMVGYNNAKPFTALFIKIMGVSPTEYRKIHRNN